MFAYPRLASLPPLAMGFWEQMHNLDEIVDGHELVPEILFVRVIYPEEHVRRQFHSIHEVADYTPSSSSFHAHPDDISWAKLEQIE